MHIAYELISGISIYYSISKKKSPAEWFSRAFFVRSVL